MIRYLTSLFLIFFSIAALADENKLLVQNYLSSFASRNAEGIYQLINWQGVDKKSQQAIKKQIKSSFSGRQIRRIYIEPITEQHPSSFIKNGQHYQLNLKPSGLLHIVYISHKGEKTSAQLLVGQHQGKTMIGSAITAP